VSTVSASLRSRICLCWGRSSSVRRSGWRVSEPGTCRTVGATGTGGGAVRVSRNGCRYPTDGLVAAPIAQRRDLCGEGGGVGVPALKRLHECETVIATEHANVSPACPRPAARRPRAWRPWPTAWANAPPGRARWLHARHRSLLKHELADQDLPRGDTRVGQGRSRRAMSSQPSSSAALAVIALRHPGHNVHHAQLDSGNRLEGTQGG
jgi:hypothetical protein